MDYDTYKNLVYGKYLVSRNTYRYVNSQRFKDYFDTLSMEQKERIIRDLSNFKLNSVKQEVNKYYRHDQTWEELRIKASAMKIVGYSRMSRSQLEREIAKRKNTS